MPIPDRYLHSPCVAAPTTSARYAARMRRRMPMPRTRYSTADPR